MTEKTFDEKRHDQLTTAPKADEGDAAPRITIEEEADGVKRIDVADTAAVRPGKPEPRTTE
ncbi:multidrug transporter [Cryobacterium arcticum]|uniref:Multidrug transporter n=1 Tax=Cryobacterium arcticum TaxID=670052 RepID=A0A317ZSI8_9MICO|nr:multidrug transporter [Cryobacterium arcticum]PXA70160.1 multidrug transporter [Cryobacterium arcticum]